MCETNETVMTISECENVKSAFNLSARSN